PSSAPRSRSSWWFGDIVSAPLRSFHHSRSISAGHKDSTTKRRGYFIPLLRVFALQTLHARSTKMMKRTSACLLVLHALGSLPNEALSFTARPLAGNPIRSTGAMCPRSSTRLHGLLPKFLTREKTSGNADVAVASEDESQEAIAPEVTELALEADSEGPADVSACEEEEELTETQTLLQKVKQAGTAGAISYALWELGFWGISIPVCVVGYRELTGHWPDFTNKEDMEKVGAEAFAFVNFARLAVPLRIGLALSTTPWIDENVVQKFTKKDAPDECEV
ncbi:hypothetical protein ACHAWF_009932, partial [Thalassiosira exigua]